MDLSPSPLPNPPPAFAIHALIALRRSLLALADRVVPGEIALLDHMAGLARTQLLGAAARLKIADLLAESPLTSEEIAARTGHNRFTRSFPSWPSWRTSNAARK